MHDEKLVLDHERRMTTMENRIAQIDKLLDGICVKLDSVVKSAADVKNWVIGGVAMFVLQQVGLVEALKLLAKKLIGG